MLAAIGPRGIHGERGLVLSIFPGEDTDCSGSLTSSYWLPGGVDFRRMPVVRVVRRTSSGSASASLSISCSAESFLFGWCDDVDDAETSCSGAMIRPRDIGRLLSGRCISAPSSTDEQGRDDFNLQLGDAWGEGFKVSGLIAKEDGPALVLPRCSDASWPDAPEAARMPATARASRSVKRRKLDGASISSTTSVPLGEVDYSPGPEFGRFLTIFTVTSMATLLISMTIVDRVFFPRIPECGGGQESASETDKGA
eukprot:TRINITY_DN63678_c0_g1_i1.p1 TRINITY_DN63678_c0_g1~~TRINITY_DN63678_c0_g1_i1.p1  ORF type:complete len:292 (-),score=31.61 TRINITY_DN63678_c0_g1_i1:76-837(-)